MSGYDEHQYDVMWCSHEQTYYWNVRDFKAFLSSQWLTVKHNVFFNFDVF